MRCGTCVALGAEIVDLVGLHLGDDPDQVGAVAEIAVMEVEPRLRNMRILVEMVDPLGVERGSAAFDTMNLIALRQQEFGEVRTVLSGYPGDQCTFCFFHLLSHTREISLNKQLILCGILMFCSI